MFEKCSIQLKFPLRLEFSNVCTIYSILNASKNLRLIHCHSHRSTSPLLSPFIDKAQKRFDYRCRNICRATALSDTLFCVCVCMCYTFSLKKNEQRKRRRRTKTRKYFRFSPLVHSYKWLNWFGSTMRFMRSFAAVALTVKMNG